MKMSDTERILSKEQRMKKQQETHLFFLTIIKIYRIF